MSRCSPVPTVNCGIRVSEDLFRELVSYVERIRAQRPGECVSLADGLRRLLMRGLEAEGVRGRVLAGLASQEASTP